MIGVLQNVAQDIRHFAARTQRVRVEPIGEDLSAPPQRAVDRACAADGKALHSARQRSCVFGFDDQVQVVSLDRVVDEAEAEAVPGSVERTLESAPDVRAAQ
jgi:hypothetical protein